MWGVTLLTLAQGLVSPFAGRAMDRHSIRALVCTGAMSAAAGFVLIAHATALWQIVAIYGTLMTAGVLLSGPLAAQTLAAKWFRRRRGLAIGLSTVGTSLGGLLLTPFVAWLFLNFGWRTAHLVLAAIMVGVIVPLVWLVVRNDPAARGVAPEPERAPNPDGSPHPSFPEHTTRSILANRNFWVTVLAFTPMVTAFGGIQQNLGPFARDMGIGDQGTSFLVSVFAGVMIGGKIFFGAMADRFDHRYLYVLAVAALAAAMALMLTHPAYPGMVVVSLLLGFAAGGFLPLMGAIVGSRFGPASFGQVLGLLGPFTTVSALGPLLAGALREITGSYDAALYVFLALIVPGVLAMAFLERLPLPSTAPAPSRSPTGA
jgi:MFS family permease